MSDKMSMICWAVFFFGCGAWFGAEVLHAWRYGHQKISPRQLSNRLERGEQYTLKKRT